MTVSIVPFSLSALDAEETSGTALAAVLGVAAPIDWPPAFNDADTRGWFRKTLAADPGAGQWLGYYVVAEIDGTPTVAGTAGYKGPPDVAGRVEIGYSIVAAYHRRGIGSAAVELLLELAFADRRVKKVMAETPVGFAPSRGLLEKCGFLHTGNRTDPEDGELALYAMERTAA